MVVQCWDYSGYQNKLYCEILFLQHKAGDYSVGITVVTKTSYIVRSYSSNTKLEITVLGLQWLPKQAILLDLIPPTQSWRLQCWDYSGYQNKLYC